MPPRPNVAAMFRADVADARQAWLKAAKRDAKESMRRVESDFLSEKNHEGEFLDFHSLRHTCGAWLAMAGAHPKAVQSVMRHSTIVLTMDTYGHLFPGQDAATVARLPNMMAQRARSPPGDRDGRSGGTPVAHEAICPVPSFSWFRIAGFGFVTLLPQVVGNHFLTSGRRLCKFSNRYQRPTMCSPVRWRSPQAMAILACM